MSQRWTHNLVALAAFVAFCWTSAAAGNHSPAAAAAAPVKIAVFAFELEDFSAVGTKAPGPIETSYLAQATQEAKRQLSESGRYIVIDTAGGAGGASEQNLRNCRGCEAAIAKQLGADQGLMGVVTNKHDRICRGRSGKRCLEREAHFQLYDRSAHGNRRLVAAWSPLADEEPHAGLAVTA